MMDSSTSPTSSPMSEDELAIKPTATEESETTAMTTINEDTEDSKLTTDPSADTSEKSEENAKAGEDPPSMSRTTSDVGGSGATAAACLPLPLLQIRPDLSVKLMPLSEDIQSNSSIQSYLDSIHILKRSTDDTSGIVTSSSESGDNGNTETVMRLQIVNLVDSTIDEEESMDDVSSTAHPTDSGRTLAGSDLPSTLDIKFQMEILKSTDASSSSSTETDEGGDAADRSTDGDQTALEEDSLTREQGTHSDKINQNKSVVSVRSVLVGTVDTSTWKVRWNDSSSWNKLDLHPTMSMDHSESGGMTTSTSKRTLEGGPKDESSEPAAQMMDDSTLMSVTEATESSGGAGVSGTHVSCDASGTSLTSSAADGSSSSSSSSTSGISVESAEISELKSRLSALKEKEAFYKSYNQQQITQLSDLSRRYDELTEDKQKMEKELNKYKDDLEASKLEGSQIKEMYQQLKEENTRIKDQIIYKNVEQRQLEMLELKNESKQLNDQVSNQQELILSLQDQLQTSQLATRQHIKTIQSHEINIRELEQSVSKVQNQYDEIQDEMNELKRDNVRLEHSLKISDERNNEVISSIKRKHREEISVLERGFSETLRMNESKLNELQSIRNNYQKKNASLAKDVRRLVSQIEQQSDIRQQGMLSVSKDSVGGGSVSLSGGGGVSGVGMSGGGSTTVSEESYARLKDENNRLCDELIRKSQSLVDALKAIAELHENAEEETYRIQQSLSSSHFYAGSGSGSSSSSSSSAMGSSVGGLPSSSHLTSGMPTVTEDTSIRTVDSVTDTLQSQIETAFAKPSSSSSSSSSSVSSKKPMSSSLGGSGGRSLSPEITTSFTPRRRSISMGLGSAGGIEIGLPSFRSSGSSSSISTGATSTTSGLSSVGSSQGTKAKLSAFQSRFKKSLSEAKMKVAEKKTVLGKQLGVSDEDGSVRDASMSKALLESQFQSLQHIANELSATIDQKETAINGLRFANSYLGKRVIVLERLMQMEPGSTIPDEESLFRQCISDEAALPDDDNIDDDDGGGAADGDAAAESAHTE